MKKLRKIPTNPARLTKPLDDISVSLQRFFIHEIKKLTLPVTNADDFTFLRTSHELFSICFKAYIPILRMKKPWNPFADFCLVELKPFFQSPFWQDPPRFKIRQDEHHTVHLWYNPMEYTTSFGAVPRRNGFRELTLLFGCPTFKILEDPEHGTYITYDAGGIDAFKA